MKQWNWKRLINMHLDDRRTAGIAGGTLEVTARWLKKFLLWCNEQMLVSPAQVKAADVALYRQYLLTNRGTHSKFYKLCSIDQALRVLRQFFHWAVTRHHLLFSPTQDLILPRIETQVPQLTVEEVERLLEAAEKIGTLSRLRNCALVELFYRGGVRRAEALRLKMKDVNLKKRTMRVVNREGHERIVALDERLAVTLERYLLECRPQLLGTRRRQAFFLSNKGTPYTGPCLHQMMWRLSEYTGIRVTAHMLRHACAVHMLAAGADFEDVQKLLGLHSTSGTARYADIATAALRRRQPSPQPRERRQLHHFLSLVESVEQD